MSHWLNNRFIVETNLVDGCQLYIQTFEKRTRYILISELLSVVEATVNTHATTPVDFRMEQRTSVPAAGGSSGILDKNKCWKQRELVDQTGKVSSVTAKDNLNGLI